MKVKNHKDKDKLKDIAIGYGFRYVKKEIRWKVERICTDMLSLQKRVEKLELSNKLQKERIRELELEVSNLDYKLRG